MGRGQGKHNPHVIDPRDVFSGKIKTTKSNQQLATDKVQSANNYDRRFNPEENTFTDDNDRVVRHLHPEENCAGRACPVHNPSVHKMTEWPVYWSWQTKALERYCPHGYYHPDPDDLEYRKDTNQENPHNCVCGCCGD